MKGWQFCMLISFIAASPKIGETVATVVQISMLICALALMFLEKDE